METAHHNRSLHYRGLVEGRAPLTFGQAAAWRFLQWYGPHAGQFNVIRSSPLPDGCTMLALEAALRRGFERHPGLRNRFAMRDGEPVQDVHRSGTVDVEVWPAPPQRAG